MQVIELVYEDLEVNTAVVQTCQHVYSAVDPNGCGAGATPVRGIPDPPLEVRYVGSAVAVTTKHVFRNRAERG